jgi:hypothetical protein
MDRYASGHRYDDVRFAAPRSHQRVLLHVVREVLSTDWSVQLAALEVVDLVEDDVDVLRRARTQLTRIDMGQVTIVQLRAMATLNLAIATLEERTGSTVARGGG